MPTFVYRAKKGPDKLVDGTIEAATVDQAVDQLDQMGLFPVAIEEASAGGRQAALAPEKPSPAPSSERPASEAPSAAPRGKKSLFGGIRSSEVTIFGRQLSTLIKSGVPILRAIQIIGDQTENPRFRAFLEHAQAEISNGNALSSVLAQYPKLFPPIYIAMVRAGEDSGTLQETLLRVAEYRQKQEEIFSRVRTAMAYPILMALTGAGTVAFMLTFVIPRLKGLFSQMGGALPLPTRLLMSVSSIFQTPYFWGGLVFVVTAVVVTVRSRPVEVRAVWSRLSLRIPVVKGFILKAEIARMARTLQLLLQAGIPILKALEITSPVMRNVVLRDTFDRAREEVRGGESLGKMLRESRVFPLFMTNLFSVGEESGKIEDALDELSGFYERETDEAIKVMTSLLEPLMILVMGAIVGFIVIAMLLPMFELNMMVK